MRHAVHYIRKHPYLSLLILAGFVFHLLIMFPSGSQYCYKDVCGIFFWGPHGHDGIRHLALHAVSFSTYPFVVPTFAGETLSGYNFLLDVIIFGLSKIGISPLFTYFKLIPLIWFPLFTWMVFKLAGKMKKSSLYTGTLLFLGYFGGSFSYFFTLWHKQELWGSSSLLSMQAGQTLTNPQFALSLICILGVLYHSIDNKLTVRQSLWYGLLLFVTLGLKFYGGVIALFLVGFYYFVQIRRQSLVYFLRCCIAPVAGTICAFLLFYYSPVKTAGAAFMFSPFAMMHAMIEDPQLVYLKDTVNARYFLQEHGWSPRLVYIELLTTALFMIFNFGVRITGLIYALFRLSMRRVSRFELAIFLSTILAACLTVFLIQRGEWWNTIQFFYYALFLANILTAQAVDDLSHTWKKVGVSAALLIVLVTLPYNLDLLHEYTAFPAPSYVSREEMKALSFLKEQPAGTVLTSAYTKDRRNNNSAPYPLYSYDDTSYIAAFSGHQLYYGDTVQLTLLGIPYTDRLAKLSTFDCSVLKNIQYVYEQSRYPYAVLFKHCGYGMKRIFKNKEAGIYSITK